MLLNLRLNVKQASRVILRVERHSSATTARPKAISPSASRKIVSLEKCAMTAQINWLTRFHSISRPICVTPIIVNINFTMGKLAKIKAGLGDNL